MEKLADWQPRLEAYLRNLQRAPRPVAAGRHDCCLFAAGAVEAQTGIDPAEAWRGRYTTFRGGLRMIRRDGHADLPALVAAHLPEIGLLAAMPGDIALVASTEGPAMGVVQGAAIYVLGAGGGLAAVPITAAQRVFAVGDR